MNTATLAASSSSAVPADCVHCGLPVPAGLELEVEIDGRRGPVCCHGCEAAVAFIHAAGLDDFYRLRTAPSRNRPGEGVASDPSAFADPEVARRYLNLTDNGRAEGVLALDGMSCAACAWVLEHGLGDLPGIREVKVELASGRLQASWDATDEQQAAAGLVAVMQRVNSLGFDAVPARPTEELALHERQRERSLKAIGIAGIGAMQVMMLAIADYAGFFTGMADDHRALVVWAQMVLTSVVVFWGARPFFLGALHTLRAGRMGIDVPVSLAIGLGWGVSTVVVLTGGLARGEHVYFDSVAMFTFFLLLGRHLEQTIRHRFARADARLDALLPAAVTRLLPDGTRESVLPARLSAFDIIEIPPGGILPADARVLTGAGEVDLAALTGEARPLRVNPGMELPAGSRNGDAGLRLEVIRAAADSALAAIPELLARAREQRPHNVHVADRVAGLLVAAVLAIAAATALAWSFIDPGRVLPITLATLMVTCPCAFALATPVTLTAATLRLRRLGVLLIDSDALERALDLRHVFFDKTGTLTRTAAVTCEPTAGYSVEDCQNMAAALERDIPHPIARALGALPATRNLVVEEARVIAGAGVEAWLGDVRWRIGRPDWARAGADSVVPESDERMDHGWIALTEDGALRGRFHIGEQLRADAAETVAELSRRGFEPAIVSGDQPDRVAAIARRLGVSRWWGGLDPAGKYALIERSDPAAGGVLYIGDGLNDAPVLGRAQVAVAMASACDFTRSAADAIVLDDRLASVVDLIDTAARTRRTIRQNLFWAIGYNVLAMPLAVLGLIAPWAAAVGMSASSLLVLGNALRLLRKRRDAASRPDAEAGAWA